ncbi:Hypothetical predicted protein [Scomber scombrus]|uniref:Uncharacterized protein n=1 Tax=Scomber scombrus TaxID=13677 RepID=A0AAV1P1F7_SCOSC
MLQPVVEHRCRFVPGPVDFIPARVELPFRLLHYCGGGIAEQGGSVEEVGSREAVNLKVRVLKGREPGQVGVPNDELPPPDVEGPVLSFLKVLLCLVTLLMIGVVGDGVGWVSGTS